jgi:large subunit ribosomal protein L35
LDLNDQALKRVTLAEPCPNAPEQRRNSGCLLYSQAAMPKMKTHSGSKKRFKVTATGKVRGRHSFTSHILEKKAPKRKRRHSQPAAISKHDVKRVKTLLGAKRS